MNAKQREQKVRVLSALECLGRPASYTKAAHQLNPPEDAESWRDVEVALQALGFDLSDKCFVGELSLPGLVRPTRHLVDVDPQGRTLYVPVDQAQLAVHCFPDSVVYTVYNLAEAVRFCEAPKPVKMIPWDRYDEKSPSLVGERVNRALAEAVEHVRNGRAVYLEGNLGTGRTRVVRRVAEYLPEMEYREALEVSKIYSRAGLIVGDLVKKRPFRAPHHTVSAKGMRQEVALAQHGVLYLDEAHHFSLEALDQVPSAVNPALVLSGEPCCGYGGKKCRCTPDVIARHQERAEKLIKRFDAVKINMEG